MKKYCYFDGLLVIHPLIAAHYSSSTTSGKNINYSSPPLKQTKHTQVEAPAAQTAPDKTYKTNITALLSFLMLWLLARFYIIEMSRRIPGWQLEDLAFLKIINTYAPRLWNNQRPDRKITRLEDWKE
jgi:hypothetical protein